MQRDTKQKWSAFLALVFVAVGASWGSCALKNHLKETLPQPAPPVPAPFLEDPTPDPTDTEIDLTLDDDDPPKEPSSIDASAAARPAWSPAGLYAPDHSDAFIVFSRGTAIDVPLTRRLVACSVVAFAAKTTAGGELEVRVEVGATPERFARGSNGVVTLVVPLASLAEGESVRVDAFVRRGTKLTDLARTSAKLGSGPLTFHPPVRPPSDHPELDIECRAVSPHDAQELFTKEAARVDSVLRSRASLEEQERATSDLAALVGWDDPRVRRRVRAASAKQPDGSPPEVSSADR